jgi:hypothetical protein
VVQPYPSPPRDSPAWVLQDSPTVAGQSDASTTRFFDKGVPQDSLAVVRQSGSGTEIHSQRTGLSGRISSDCLAAHRATVQPTSRYTNPISTHLRGIVEARVCQCRLVVPRGWQALHCRPSCPPATIVPVRKSRRR